MDKVQGHYLIIAPESDDMNAGAKIGAVHLIFA
jgi:hypothetical protein